MSRRHLLDFLDSRTPEEGAERQVITAFLSVLKHKAILDTCDIDALVTIAENGTSGRDRVRACEMLARSRQIAAEAVAHATAIRENVMQAKGLGRGGTKVNVLSFQGTELERLKALAERRPILAAEKIIDVRLDTPPPSTPAPVKQSPGEEPSS